LEARGKMLCKTHVIGTYSKGSLLSNCHDF